MLRRLSTLAAIFLLVSGFLFASLTSNKVAASDRSDLKSLRSTARQDAHEIKITPWGPSQETVDAAKANLPRHPAVQSYLKGTKSRLISFELLDGKKVNGNMEPSEGY